MTPHHLTTAGRATEYAALIESKLASVPRNPDGSHKPYLITKACWPGLSHGQTGTRARWVKAYLAGRGASKVPVSPIVRSAEAGPELPETLYQPRKPFILPAGKWLVLADIHVPFMDTEALKIAIASGLAAGCTNVLLLGDVVDHYSISRYEKKRELRDFAREVRKTHELLSFLRYKFANGLVVWKIGNHEARWDEFIATRAPELEGLPNISFEAIYRTKDFGIQMVASKQFIKAGGLTLIHGHEKKHGIAAPVNPARGLLITCYDSVMCGHHHQTSENSVTTITDKVIACWSVGCLSDLRPDYNPISRYNLGFAILNLDESGQYRVQNRKIIGGEVY